MIRRFLALAVLPASLAFSGCAGISYQQYGSPTQLYSVSPYANRVEVVANMGQPDAIHKDGEREVYVYHALRGANYFGLYATIARDDTIIIIEPDGTIQIDPIQVEVARGRTYFGAPFFADATHPIPTTEVRRAPMGPRQSVD